MPRAMAIALLWMTAAACAWGRDLYVDNVGGNDALDASAPQSLGSGVGPCRTIARALRTADKGDRIILAASGEPYRESITLQAGRHSGLPGQPFEVVGNGAILEGAFDVPREAWEHVRGNVFRFSPARKAFQLIFLDGKPAARVAVAPGTVNMPELQPLQWCLFERQVYFCTEAERLPWHYNLSCCGHTVGITLYEVRHVVISDVVVQGFQLDGINSHDGATDVTLARVTCRGNGRSGISIGGASRVRIEASLIGNNGAAQLRTEGQSHTLVVDSDLLDNTAPPLVRAGGEVRFEQTPATPPDALPAEPPAASTGGRRYSVVRREWPAGTAYR